MTAASSGSSAGPSGVPGSTGVEASEEADVAMHSGICVLSRLGELCGASEVSGRLPSIPFGLLLRKVTHSGLMGASVDWDGCVSV